MLNLPIYLDHNSTTPCDPRVVEAMLPWFTTHFGNAASSSHLFGWQAKEAVDIAREQVAALLGADPFEIVFTSGATESDNLGIKGVFEAYGSKGKHIITCVTEHKAVLDTLHHLERSGAEITWLPVNENGQPDIRQLERSIRPDTILIAMMYANNETGNVLPVTAIAALARARGIIFFSDAAQAAGKIPVDVNADGIDLLAISGHKMYGPKGVGALYVRRRDPRVRVIAQMDGGGHERNMRSGTLNVPAIVGLGKACEIAMNEMDNDRIRLSALRDRLEAGLLQIPGVKVNGDPVHRLPHVTNLSFQHAESQALMLNFSRSLAVSSGSACSSATLEPSYVLRAMGLSDELAGGSLRFGLGKSNTEEDIDYAIREVSGALSALRAIAGNESFS